MKTAVRYLILTAMSLAAISAFLYGNILGAWALVSLGLLSEVLFRLGIVDSLSGDEPN